MQVSPSVMNRRAAVERWKNNHREYYLAQKRSLARRPEYRAVCRARYKAKREALTEAGMLPRKLGRPVLYEGQDAIDRKRERAREASLRYRRRQTLRQFLSLLLLNHESTQGESACEDSDRSSDSEWDATEGTEVRCGPGYIGRSSLTNLI